MDEKSGSDIESTQRAGNVSENAPPTVNAATDFPSFDEQLPTTNVIAFGRQNEKRKASNRRDNLTSHNTDDSLADRPWYHGLISRDEAVKLLQRDGMFLVRESTGTGIQAPKVLSVYWEGKVFHHILEEIVMEDGGKTEIGFVLGNRQYLSLTAMINDHVKKSHRIQPTADGKCKGMLITPAPKSAWIQRWQLCGIDVSLTETIGRGSFGEVWRGTYTKDRLVLDVAVKTCNTNAKTDQRLSFLHEAKIMSKLSHPNIVNLIGIVTEMNPIMIVMEYIDGGPLFKHLKKKSATAKQRLMFCLDAAKGMDYLETQNVIHRDLAGRNCLLTAGLSLKIADFGLSREGPIYKGDLKNEGVPIKWTAPDALKTGVYSCKTDCWSFGILLWEIYSDGKMPYGTMDNRATIIALTEGTRLDNPPGCPEAVHKIMLKCWHNIPDERPSFNELFKELREIEKTLESAKKVRSSDSSTLSSKSRQSKRKSEDYT